jgi:hypothetical protein
MADTSIAEAAGMENVGSRTAAADACRNKSRRRSLGLARLSFVAVGGDGNMLLLLLLVGLSQEEDGVIQDRPSMAEGRAILAWPTRRDSVAGTSSPKSRLGNHMTRAMHYGRYTRTVVILR